MIIKIQLSFFLHKFFEIMITCSQKHVPQVTTSRIISYIFTMMMVMERWTAHQRKHSQRSPWELVTCMTLISQHYFVSYPEKVCEAMNFRTKNNHSKSGRNLYKIVSTTLPRIRSTGWKYSVATVKTLSYSWWTLWNLYRVLHSWKRRCPQ